LIFCQFDFKTTNTTVSKFALVVVLLACCTGPLLWRSVQIKLCYP